MPSKRHTPKVLGTTVRALRLKAGFSQMVLAEKADLTLNYVGEIERGEKLASLETVLKLAKALNLTGAQLLTRAEL